MSVYDLADYGAMIADRGRIAALARALETRITPSSVVLDIGSGMGVLALLACRAGAARVYAVEADDVIHVARDVAAANGFADRIRFVQAMTTEIDLPERVDGIVCDLQGSLPLFGKSLVSILDARARFLKPAGWIIPARDTIWIALAHSASTRARIVEAWTNEYGLDLSSARQRTTNQPRNARVDANDLLVEPQRWAVLDYSSFERPNLSGQMTWTMERAAVGHGMSVWFDAETASGITFSNSPISGERHVYGQAFLPWPDAIELSPGDQVSVQLRADFVGADYVWGWDTRVMDGGSRRVKATHRQSSWLAAPFGSEQLRKRAHTFVPDLNDDARIDRRILDLMERKLPLSETATIILGEFPSSFKNWDAALTRAGCLSARYSK